LIKVKNYLKEEGMTIKGAKIKLEGSKEDTSLNFKIVEDLKDILKIL
jgi:uncharacterized OsmC-like protein